MGLRDYELPFSGPKQKEFARSRAVINQVRAAKIRARRAARKSGTAEGHEKDAAILMEGERLGIPFGGVASKRKLDQMVLAAMDQKGQQAGNLIQNRFQNWRAGINAQNAAAAGIPGAQPGAQPVAKPEADDDADDADDDVDDDEDDVDPDVEDEDEGGGSSTLPTGISTEPTSVLGWYDKDKWRKNNEFFRNFRNMRNFNNTGGMA